MDSEDDMHDANDIESLDDFYSEDTAIDSDDVAAVDDDSDDDYADFTSNRNQIAECRRVLKWTYAYGYYLPEHEHAKRQFFEYLQGEVEAGLERLHQCAEKELQLYLLAVGPSKDFNEFRTKLAGLTSVTKNYFENLVRALENGLSDVDLHVTTSQTTSSKIGGSGSRSGKGKGASLKSGSSSRSNAEDSTHWSCEHCTFANVRPRTVCQMCHNRR